MIDSKIKKIRQALNEELKAYSEMAEELQSIQDEADVYIEMWQRKDGAESDAKSLRMEIGSLQMEMQELMSEYQKAQFRDDVDEEVRIKNRRADIEDELKELGNKIDQLRTVSENNTPSSVEVAKLKARLDAIPERNPEYIIGKVKPLLKGLDSQLSSVAHDLNLSDAFRDLDEDVYQETRLEIDDVYAARHRAVEKEAAAYQKLEEKKKRFINPFSTPPSVDPRVSTRYAGDK